MTPMPDGAVVTRYARAFVEAAQAAGQLTETWGALETLTKRIRREERVWCLLQHPFIPWTEKQAMLRAVDDRPLPPLVEALVGLLIRRKRLALLPVLVAQVEERVKTVGGHARAQVKTAVPLPNQTQHRLETILARMFHRPVRLEAILDPELLAGAVVRVDDVIMDYSLRGQLRALQRRLLGGRR